MEPALQRFVDLDAVARVAGDALDRANQPLLFDRLDWYRLLHAHCPPPGRFEAWQAQAGSKQAWLFLAVRGSSASAFANYYSLRFDIAGNHAPDLLAALATGLRRRFARLELAPFANPEPLAEALRQAGWWVSVRPAAVNWRLAINGDFDAYWAQRPSRLRSTARRRAKAVDLEINIFNHFTEEAWNDYEEVYRASWKPEEGSFPFLRALARRESEAGALRLGIARHQGRPVAAQLWLIENSTAWIHKLAYAEDAKSWSPGTLLSESMFRAAIDQDRVKCIDYGNGDESYKADWMESRHLLWRISAMNPRRLSGLVGTARAAVGRLARSFRSV
jgi:hypothetical protein